MKVINKFIIVLTVLVLIVLLILLVSQTLRLQEIEVTLDKLSQTILSSGSKDVTFTGINSSVNDANYVNDEEDEGFEKSVSDVEGTDAIEHTKNQGYLVAWTMAKEVAPSNFNLASLYYFNAISKNSGSYDLWNDYVTDALQYGTYDDIVIAYSNIDKGFLEVEPENIIKLVNLRDSMEDTIIEYNTNLANEQLLSLDDKIFLNQCDKFLELFTSKATTFETIQEKFIKLTDSYADYEISSSANNAYEYALNLYELLSALNETQSYGSYALADIKNIRDMMAVVQVVETSILTIKQEYSTFKLVYPLFEESIISLENSFDTMMSKTLELLNLDIEINRPNIKDLANKLALRKLSEYQLYLQEMLQISGNHNWLYSAINTEIENCSNSMNEIFNMQKIAYQKWAYSVIKDLMILIEAKDYTVYKYYEFSLINSSLCIPEIQVLYQDTNKKIKSRLSENYNKLIEYSTEQGLKSYEDL